MGPREGTVGFAAQRCDTWRRRRATRAEQMGLGKGQPEERRTGLMHLAGLGVEFAAAMVGFVLVGLWVDYHWGTRPWGVLVGAMLGMIGGGYNMLRQSLRAARKSQREAEERRRAGTHRRADENR